MRKPEAAAFTSSRFASTPSEARFKAEAAEARRRFPGTSRWNFTYDKSGRLVRITPIYKRTVTPRPGCSPEELARRLEEIEASL